MATLKDTIIIGNLNVTGSIRFNGKNLSDTYTSAFTGTNNGSFTTAGGIITATGLGLSITDSGKTFETSLTNDSTKVPVSSAVKTYVDDSIPTYTQTHTTTSHSSGYEKIGSIGGTDVLVGKAGGGLFGLVKTGTGITNSNGEISITKSGITSILGAATTSAAGLMSADDKKNLTYYVKGTQTASTNAWTGNLTQVDALYEGLTIRYRLPYAGTSTGATLNLTLSGGATGAKNIYRYGTTTQITTHFAAGSVITMTYNGTNWIADAFYDSNSYAYVRQYKTTTDATYPLLFAYETALPSSYDTKYTRKNSNLTFNPSTGQLNATILSAGVTSSTNGQVVFQNVGGGTITLTPGVDSAYIGTLYLPENNGKTLMLGITTTDGDEYADDEGLMTSTLATKTYVDNAVANAGGGSSTSIYRHTLTFGTNVITRAYDEKPSGATGSDTYTLYLVYEDTHENVVTPANNTMMQVYTSGQFGTRIGEGIFKNGTVGYYAILVGPSSGYTAYIGLRSVGTVTFGNGSNHTVVQIA